MADLGSIGRDHLIGRRTGVIVSPWRPIGGIRTAPGRTPLDMTPLFNMVDSPTSKAGTLSIECYTSGTRSWQMPVEPNTSVTVSIAVRKTSGYVAAFGGFRTLTNLLPYLVVTRSDGTVFVDTMDDVVDTWDTLTITVPITERGVLTIAAITPGLPGTSGFFALRASLTTRLVCKVWWNNLTASVASG